MKTRNFVFILLYVLQMCDLCSVLILLLLQTKVGLCFSNWSQHAKNIKSLLLLLLQKGVLALILY